MVRPMATSSQQLGAGSEDNEQTDGTRPALLIGVCPAVRQEQNFFFNSAECLVTSKRPQETFDAVTAGQTDRIGL